MHLGEMVRVSLRIIRVRSTGARALSQSAGQHTHDP